MTSQFSFPTASSGVTRVGLLDVPGLAWDITTHTLYLIAPSDDPVLADHALDGVLTLAVSQRGTSPVLHVQIRSRDGQYRTALQAIAPWRPFDTDTDAPRHRWTLVIVSGSPGSERPASADTRPMRIIGIRLFTTSTAFATTLHRLRTDQWAAGPVASTQMPPDTSRRRISSSWRHALAVTQAGD